MDRERRLRALGIVLRVAGATFALGLPVLVRVFPGAFMWEPRQPEHEQMIVGIYVTLGVFLWVAARDPLRHLSLVWFTVWSSFVHGGIMLVRALVDPAERANLVGDIPALFAVAIVLGVLAPREKDLPPGPAAPGAPA